MNIRNTIGVIGSGPIGRGIATLLSRSDYSVTLGTRNPSAAKLRDLPAEVAVGSFADAADQETIVLSVVHGVARDLVAGVRARLAGKVVIDTMNAWIRADYVAAGLSEQLTEGSWLAAQLPESSVARAYSHIDWDLLVPRATQQPGVWAAAYAADDPGTRAVTERVIHDSGYVPVLVGKLAESAPLDVGGLLWARMFKPEHMIALLGADEASRNGRHF
ncbi:NADPH-dependent F420 reductase [Dactylosporangium darangshiense]|uniref:NADPH-dependent F420 reductase n=1 Tax=Dactylosporangium darangshiense TaxID=579108 RepID=A0ABP8DUF7_9ACTN